MAKYIQATMSNGIDIRILDQKDAKAPVAKILKTIHINGGANVRDRRSMITPIGALTEVSDDDYALLETNHVFRQLKKNGYIVVTGDHHLNVKDNEKKDKSAQMKEADLKKLRPQSEKPVPSVGAPEEA